jgi:hypothetical protein
MTSLSPDVLDKILCSFKSDQEEAKEELLAYFEEHRVYGVTPKDIYTMFYLLRLVKLLVDDAGGKL